MDRCPGYHKPSRLHRTAVCVVIFALLTAGGCAIRAQSGGKGPNSAPVPRERFESVRAELETLRRENEELRLELAQTRQQNERIARDTERLRADIEDAEEALVALESGLKGLHTRADAVSALADARIVVTRAAHQAPWRRASIERAREKLAEAERHIEEEYFGSAVFFTVRGRRIAEEILSSARSLRDDPDTRYVSVDRANVRAHASMNADIVTVLEQGTPVQIRGKNENWVQIVTLDNEGGWIHRSLLAIEP